MRAPKATLWYIYQGEEGAPDYGWPYLPQPGYSPVTGSLVNPGYNGNGSPVIPVPIPATPGLASPQARCATSSLPRRIS